MEVWREDMILHGPWSCKVVWRHFKGLMFEKGNYAIFCVRRVYTTKRKASWESRSYLSVISLLLTTDNSKVL